MKRAFAVISAVMLFSLLFACGRSNIENAATGQETYTTEDTTTEPEMYTLNTEDVEVTLGESERFAPEELQAAVDCALRDCSNTNVNWGKDWKLLRLWYDEAEANIAMDSWIAYGGWASAGQGAERENIILLFTEFLFPDYPMGDGQKADRIFDDWEWVLVRDNKESDWRVASR